MRKIVRAVGVIRIVLEQMPILLQGRSASCCRHDNWPVRFRREGIDICAGHLTSGIEHAAMHLESPTASLTRWDVHIRPIARHNPASGSVRVTEGRAHDAA